MDFINKINNFYDKNWLLFEQIINNFANENEAIVDQTQVKPF